MGPLPHGPEGEGALADGHQDAVVEALPDDVGLAEAGVAEGADLEVQAGVDPLAVAPGEAALALGDQVAQGRLGLDRLPPALPVLGEALGLDGLAAGLPDLHRHR